MSDGIYEPDDGDEVVTGLTDGRQEENVASSLGAFGELFAVHLLGEVVADML